MSFDSHSLERLRELGRQLPKPLPCPDVNISENPPANKRRHRVETEDDPQALFKELMQVSPDGNVPPHLMARLREIEAKLASIDKMKSDFEEMKDKVIWADAW